MKLSINGVNKKQIKSVKFLGLIINENLNWDDHVNNIILKVTRATGVLNRLKYHLPKDTILTIYYALIHSHFNNHILLWGTNLKKLLASYLENPFYHIQLRYSRY